MSCSPELNSIQPPIFPPIPTPGGLPFAPIQIPFPNIKLPTDLLEDIVDLVNKLGLLFPSSTFKPTPDEFTKTILDAIANLLSQVAPFLSLYSFIMSAFKLILCIVEVLCALPNPFKVASKMIKLFKECLPPFLALFPFLALIAMIIALLLLILALIEYIIATIIALIAEIVANLKILGEGVTLQDSEATLAAIQKISDLLCIIQNIMAIFIALSAIMSIIKALASIAGGPICDDADPLGCCSPDVCPPFIKDGPITSTAGQLNYHNQIGVNTATALGISPDLAALFNIPPTRVERWQFVDTGANTHHHFSEIITPVIDSSVDPPIVATFWPEGTTFDANTAPNKFPYVVDLRIKMDPIVFFPADTKGLRNIRIKGCGVVRRPYIGVFNYIDVIDPLSNATGTLNLEGGLVYEDDGTTKYMIGTEQATLNTFIHKDPLIQNIAQSTEDAVIFSNIEYIFTPVYGTLMSYNLITVGCMPALSLEKATFNNVVVAEDIRAVVDKLNDRKPGVLVPSTGFLPNVSGTQDCVLNALAEFRKNVSIENAAIFQATAITCLHDLRDQSSSLVCEAIIASVSQFKSTASLDTDVQFTSRPITVIVTLKDASGTNLGKSVPAQCVVEIENDISGEVNFGKLSSFKYDGSQFFTAQLFSETPGSGVLHILFKEKVFSIVDTTTTPTSISETSINYNFIGVTTEPANRRNETDVTGRNETDVSESGG